MKKGKNTSVISMVLQVSRTAIVTRTEEDWYEIPPLSSEVTVSGLAV